MFYAILFKFQSNEGLESTLLINQPSSYKIGLFKLFYLLFKKLNEADKSSIATKDT